jgi:hypothetical protein
MSKGTALIPHPHNCRSCVAWAQLKDRPMFGGCARGGKTTTRWGDDAYNFYTTDQQTCSAFELRLAKSPDQLQVEEVERQRRQLAKESHRIA